MGSDGNLEWPSLSNVVVKHNIALPCHLMMEVPAVPIAIIKPWLLTSCHLPHWLYLWEASRGHWKLWPCDCGDATEAKTLRTCHKYPSFCAIPSLKDCWTRCHNLKTTYKGSSRQIHFPAKTLFHILHTSDPKKDVLRISKPIILCVPFYKFIRKKLIIE